MAGIYRIRVKIEQIRLKFKIKNSDKGRYISDPGRTITLEQLYQLIILRQS